MNGAKGSRAQGQDVGTKKWVNRHSSRKARLNGKREIRAKEKRVRQAGQKICRDEG